MRDYWWAEERRKLWSLFPVFSVSDVFADNGYVSPMASSPMGNVPSVVPVPTAGPTVSPASALGVLAHRFQ